jgi:hypothetical protein
MEDVPFLITDCCSNIEKTPCINARLVSRVYKLKTKFLRVYITGTLK